MMMVQVRKEDKHRSDGYGVHNIEGQIEHSIKCEIDKFNYWTTVHAQRVSKVK